jgi:hypothetical protein
VANWTVARYGRRFADELLDGGGPEPAQPDRDDSRAARLRELGSLGIMIGGLGTMCPERRDGIVALGL